MIKAFASRVIGSFSGPSFLLGVVFFTASLTPSLIPRGPDTQGILGGLVTALGYLTGQMLWALWRAADLPVLPERSARAVTWLSTTLVAILFVWVLFSSLSWQNDLRLKMDMEPAESLNLLRILLAAALVFATAFLAGRMVASLFRLIRAWFYRTMPPRRANVLGFTSVVVLLVVATHDGILDRSIHALDESYEAAQELFERAPPSPTDPMKVGGPTSLIDWAAIGTPGRNFITSGPNAEAITAFTGREALEPIRVYVGRANGDTPRERADLALAELQRLGAFDREVLVVTSPTGTGWMDPGSHDPLEYMHNGDVATVAVQYSYLQSALALILETQTGLEQAVALQEVVHGYWQTLSPEDRPRLYMHGLSLGAWSSMHATNLFRLSGDPIDGAFWAGPPFPSNFWNDVQDQRNPGSPWVLPEIGDGSLVRYASHISDASDAPAEWSDMRLVFLQYSSDPVVFYEPASFWRPPQWMREAPAADMSDSLIFMPIVTQFQLLLDIALSFGSPPGHGHAYYSADYIGPWVQVTDPAGWTRADTERLVAHCDNGYLVGCSNQVR
ncbi:MAG: alpha/beta-hydrolase family protein [Pseudomonadota bacterium]